MRSAIAITAIAGLSGLAIAAPRPRPQDFDDAYWDFVDSNPPPTSVLGAQLTVTADVVTYSASVVAASIAAAIPTNPIVAPSALADDSAAAATSAAATSAAVAASTAEAGARKARRDQDCSSNEVQPAGNGPPIHNPDTTDAFLSNTALQQMAINAVTPSGYKAAFTNLQGATQQIGYFTYEAMDSYDVQKCADKCTNEKQCIGFNIYIERDPSVAPDYASCTNPPSITNYKCSIYGYPVAAGSATNTDQWRSQFHVVITASNGYNKLGWTPTPNSNFTAPQALPAAINAPLDNGVDTYMGMKIYNPNPNIYDPNLCAAACQAQSAYNLKTSKGNPWKRCTFFNAYVLTKNGSPQGIYCSFYTRSWSASYAVNNGQWRGSDRYDVVQSFSYSITAPYPY